MVTSVDRGSTFALRRSTLDFCLGGQRSLYRAGELGYLAHEKALTLLGPP